MFLLGYHYNNIINLILNLEIMEMLKVLENLCYHDSKNPNSDYDEEEAQEYKERLELKDEKCFCDNCFYKRTELANEILRINGLIGRL